MSFWKQAALSVVIAACIVITSVSAARSANTRNSTAVTQADNANGYPSLTCPFFSQQAFEKVLSAASTLTAPFPRNNVQVGIIPHDLAHAEYIAHFFKNIQQQKPSTLILIGPNHYERGMTDVITSGATWQLAFQNVEADQYVISQLTGFTGIEDNSAIISADHAVTGAIPYIARYLPNTKIVPILIKSGVSTGQISALIEKLQSVVPKDSVLIASVDFSHYLMREQAEAYDRTTREKLLSLDDGFFLALGKNFNDYVDSPPAIAFALRWAKLSGARNGEILYNTNSAALAGFSNSQTTTYFEAVYY